jgi:hypothetical protein
MVALLLTIRDGLAMVSRWMVNGGLDAPAARIEGECVLPEHVARSIQHGRAASNPLRHKDFGYHVTVMYGSVAA